MTKPKSTRIRKTGRLTETARQRLWFAIRQILESKIDGEIDALDVLTFVEESEKRGKGVSYDLICDFLNVSPSIDREFSKAKILFNCFNVSLTESADDWIPKTPTAPAEPSHATPQIDWLDRSRQLLAAQKHLTTNRLLNKSNRNLDDIHVPLGLIERKERPKSKEVEDAAQGSQIYHPVEYIDTKRFEHEAFLTEVVGKPAGGKHIAIIGEPGAGKTTILTKIGAWLIGQAEQQPPAPLVVAWISLADVGDRRLQAYLRDEWLQKVCEDNFDAAWEDWKGLRQQGRVWLLLDGLDEMSGDALAAIHRDLGLAWAQNLWVAITCRLNQWEASAGGNILTDSFDVYRTLDYSYQTSQGDDQVKDFISKWFADNERVANQIRTELDAPGKERIKDLVKNPLRLTLLCASWEKDNQAIPETQADLYRGFVDYLYDWKADKFSKEVELREELDLALGKLAKEGLNREPMNDGAVRRFRFTTLEISGLWGKRSKKLLAAAKNLGWLNVVEKNTYAFYHPTFQEYFAACSIDDWDYFLPRGHIDRPVNFQGGDKLTYRVFEKQWRQPILLWIGRADIKPHLKETFLNRIMTSAEISSQTSFPHQKINGLTWEEWNRLEATLIKPQAFDESTIRIVVELLQKNKSIIIATNLISMNPQGEAQRLIDFISGATYSVEGHYERISDNLFCFDGSCDLVLNWQNEQLYNIYCMAGNCIAEFESINSSEILENITKWAVGFATPSVQGVACQVICSNPGGYGFLTLINFLKYSINQRAIIFACDLLLMLCLENKELIDELNKIRFVTKNKTLKRNITYLKHLLKKEKLFNELKKTSCIAEDEVWKQKARRITANHEKSMETLWVSDPEDYK